MQDGGASQIKVNPTKVCDHQSHPVEGSPDQTILFQVIKVQDIV